MWTKAAADDRQPCEKMAAKLKEKHKKHTAAYEAKGEPGAAKKGAVRLERARERGKRKKRKKVMHELALAQLFFSCL